MSTLSIDLRLARPEDAAAVAAVHDATWRYAYRGLLPGVDLERMVERRGPLWWKRAIARNILIVVLVVNGRLVGYATLGPSRMRGLPYQGEIYEIYLHPDYQGLGFGRRLFEAARRLLVDRNFAGLAVRALSGNEMAVGFYRRLGGLQVLESGERIGDSVLPVMIFGWPSGE